jgi:hypothetical protein
VPIAIASIRRAAVSLRESQQDLNISAIAHALNAPHHEVRSYLRGVSGLALELGIRIPVQKQSVARYEDAVQELRKSNRPVSRQGIAEITGCRIRTISAFFARNPEYIKRWGVSTAGEVARQELREELVKIVGELRQKEKGATRQDIARMLAMNQRCFYKLLKADPTLFAIIKPVIVRVPRGPELH